MDQIDIECKQHRPGGTKIELDKTEYHFQPLADGAHVAAVADDAHVARLLSIPEAYKLYRGKEVAAAVAAQYTVKIDDIGAVAGLSLMNAIQSGEPVAPVALKDDAKAKALTSLITAITAPFDPLWVATDTPSGDTPPVHDILLGSSVHPYSFDIHGRAYSIGDVIEKAHAATGMSVEDWNLLQDETRADFIDEQLETIQAAGPVSREPAPSAPPAWPAIAAPTVKIEPEAKVVDPVRADLEAQYKELYGKPAHYRMSVDKLRAMIAEFDGRTASTPKKKK
jgi:hypothetical protein